MIGLRVAHLIPDLAASSAASECALLVRWLLTNGHDVLLVTADEQRAADLAAVGAELAVGPDAAATKRLKSRKKLAADVADWAPDLIHVHHITSLPLAIHLADQLEVPLVVSVHAPHPVDDLSEFLAHQAVRLVVVPNDAMRAHYCGRVGLAPDRVAMLPYGVDCSTLRPEPEVPSGGPLRIGMAGNAGDEGAGFTDLIAALVGLRERERSFAATFLGRGSGLDSLRGQITAAGLEAEATVAELIGDLGPVLGEFDIFVYPVHRDHNILCLAKAMGACCGAVATTVGGVPELVTDGHNGILIPPGDGSALVDALDRLCGDRALVAELGRAARETIASKFSADLVGCAAHELYRGLLRRGASAKTGTEIVNTWRRIAGDPASIDGVA